MARVASVLLCLVLSAAPADGQVVDGRLVVALTDDSGRAVPDVTVAITGLLPASAATDLSGLAHFRNLLSGRYAVSLRRPGDIDQSLGSVEVFPTANVELRATIAGGKVVRVQSRVVPPAGAPGATWVTRRELDQLPFAGDIWSLAQSVPGVVADRLHGGGVASGLQATLLAKGAAPTNTVWSVDGVDLTDMTATGSSPAYFSFDLFQAVTVSAGGPDIAAVSSGLAMNLVLRSGGSVPRGSFRIAGMRDDLGMQANNVSDDLAPSVGGAHGQGARLVHHLSGGIEFGGPLRRNRAWLWGGMGRTDLRVLARDDVRDETQLEHYAAKFTARPHSALRTNVTFLRDEKLKPHRGASATRSDATTWRQSGPANLLSADLSVSVRNPTVVTVRATAVRAGFRLSPRGGLDASMIFADDLGVARNSWYQYETTQPQRTLGLDVSHARGRHEFRAALGYRVVDDTATFTVPGDGIITFHDGYPNMIAEVTAWNQISSTSARYWSGSLVDSWSTDRLTMSAGLRWDRQSASVRRHVQRGNDLLPGLLPDVSSAGIRDVIVWNTLSPRVGVTWSVDASKRTRGRVGYAVFPSRMSAGQGSFMATGSTIRGVYIYDVIDRNGNGVVDASEIVGELPQDWYGFDIENPGGSDSSSHIVGNHRAPRTRELTVGVERDVWPTLTVSATYTGRIVDRFNWRPIAGLRSDGYVQTGTYRGTVAPVGVFAVPLYGVSALPAAPERTEYVERPGYLQRFHGLDVSAARRLSGRWSARAAFSWNRHREYFEGDASRTDPTATPREANLNGGDVVTTAEGSGAGAVYMVLPRYQFVGSGTFLAPKGFSLSANLLVREGFAKPYYASLTNSGDPLSPAKAVLVVSDPVRFRLPPVTTVDVRLDKAFPWGPSRWQVSLDLLNALNAATVLARQYDIGAGNGDSITEILNPRVLSLGVRVSF